MPRPFPELRTAARSAAVNFQAGAHCLVGAAGAALLAENGRIYTGASVDLSCGIGFCAEHTAVAAMLKDKQTHVSVMVAVDHKDNVLPPCGRCRELLDQIDSRNRQTKVMVAPGKAVKLSELLPFPWRKR